MSKITSNKARLLAHRAMLDAARAYAAAFYAHCDALENGSDLATELAKVESNLEQAALVWASAERTSLR